MKFNLYEAAREKLLVVAHRGVFGGNIPCNTMASYEIALRQGADMIETDVNITLDEKLIVFHPTMEPAHLCTEKLLPSMTWKQVSGLRYVNADNVPTQFGVESFDDLLEQFKGRCFINVDKFWDHPKQIYQTIKRHGMLDQVVVKAPPKEEVLRVLEELAPELAYMPVVKISFDGYEKLMQRNINFVGVEALFYDDGDPIVSEAFFEKIHGAGKLMWANSIIYDYEKQIAAGHSDDTALTQSEELGWGWLADRGFDLIQTDWPMMLIDYLKRSQKYYKVKT